ncbi:hypothetical protein BU14_0513s0017 [Porphyra umbilicalis]|uniref:PBS-linker domain-containing protein n=1 Tax=Porphyra umbilicalis TaxID=2786 RepID=A0A1X6NTF5_PORUM|nr:hypothetical protein BU14_0513s0017 [Porphyra umbilicalis]|eukprot:OSX71673.1 hypothetical protein BU14_0513s0017 [Porphyra umbilicalis]
MAFSSIQNVLTDAPVSVPEASVADAITAVYKQVLGNAHLMESERAELATAESQFALTTDVRAFVRAVGVSSAHTSRFFDSGSLVRFTELAFKHFLGRGPRDRAEWAAAMAAYHSGGGVAGVVDWCVNSDEYAEAFGDSTVPYCMFKGAYPTNEEFNRMLVLRGPWSSSDKVAGGVDRLAGAVAGGSSPNWLSISKGLPAGTERGTGFVIASRWTSTQRNPKAPVRVGRKIPGGVVFN